MSPSLSLDHGHGLAQPQLPRVKAPARHLGILVVDDDALLRTLLYEVLRQEGIAVWTAANGFEALTLYDQQRGAIDLVLLDVNMPGRDGPETLAALRRLDPEVRCCYMTAGAGPYTEADLLAGGVCGLIRKPFRLFEAAHSLRQLAAR
jgi:two-component system, OmpR family, response regulator